MPYTIVDLPTLEGRLLEARLALHNIMIGGKPQSVGYEGKSVTYSQANASELQAYITMLEREIAKLIGTYQVGPVAIRF
jgi:hypothetical protein